MCGIFGSISNGAVDKNNLRTLALHIRRRGSDSSGLVYHDGNCYKVIHTDYDIMQLLKKEKWSGSNVVLGHCRLIDNGFFDNQPIVRDGILVIHDGIIVNEEQIRKSLNLQGHFLVDSEGIIAIAKKHLDEGGGLRELPEKILSICKGTVTAALVIPESGKVLLFSNNGSLYVGKKETDIYFASERYPLDNVECDDIVQLWREGLLIDIPKAETITAIDDQRRKGYFNPIFKHVAAEEAMLQYPQPDLKRCTKCILPETMPFISFDSDGVCNYCHNYSLRNVPKPKDELFELVEPYRLKNKPDCIVPFSGGRDSSYALHLIVNELKMNPITYTYDWGMVTSLGNRNISRMCSELGVENIVVAADISKKRQNIVKNLKAWLKSPHLGMISILTAGDKHFFQHVESVKKETGIDLNLWGINPLEVTHFKAGFLGVKPDFEEKRVYMPGLYNQLNYQFLRFKAMLKSPSYFNSSLGDTLSGEYYRSFAEKKDYYHVFDYWQWDEKIIDETLRQYDWELAPDTNTTWRIGDGTAAFYNYIYYTVAGFTEHDTFRSNQIREGQIKREEALRLVKDENRPRYQNIRWYLDALNMDFSAVIEVINAIPKLYSMEND